MKQKKKARPRGRLEHQLYPRYLTLPAFILFTVFFILPILGGVGISLTNWTVSRPSITRFVGLKNYITMFQDDDILLAFKNTAIFTVAIVILRNLFAILLALALVKKLYTRTYLRTIFYIPAVLSYVVVGIMFTAMFQMNGTFNQILNAFGIPCTKEWLASGDTALLMVIVEDVWKWTGFHMIIYIAGLQAIPTDLYEAAKIDGASAVRTFFSVTLPLLIPSLTINVTQAIIGGFRVFEQVLTLTDGGPGHQSTVVSMMVYEYFGRGFYGKSTAISMMLSVIVLFVTLAVRGYFNNHNHRPRRWFAQAPLGPITSRTYRFIESSFYCMMRPTAIEIAAWRILLFVSPWLSVFLNHTLSPAFQTCSSLHSDIFSGHS